MKLRFGFISNSSSSSFYVNKKHLTAKQMKIIGHIDEVIEKLKPKAYKDNNWIKKVTNNAYYFSTWMDNFDMISFLGDLGISTTEYEPKTDYDLDEVLELIEEDA